MNQHSLPLEIPERRPPPPAVPLAEDDSFALAAVYPAGQVSHHQSPTASRAGTALLNGEIFAAVDARRNCFMSVDEG